MSLLDKIPDAQVFEGILTRLIGDQSGEGGIAGALKVLDDLDTENLASTLVSSLDETLAEDISFDREAFTGETMSRFEEAVASLPSDPAELVGPLRNNLERIKAVATEELPGKLTGPIQDLQKVQALVPADTRALVASAAEGLTGLKSQFTSGEWSALRRWSVSVERLRGEMDGVFGGTEGTVQDRLVAYVSGKMEDLVEVVLPSPQGLTEGWSDLLGQAIAGDPANQLEALKQDLIGHMKNALVEFERGNFSNAAHLNQAKACFKRLTSDLTAIVSDLDSIVNTDIASADGLIGALSHQLDHLEGVEVIDLGNIRDRFIGAIRSAEEAVQGMRLERLREAIGEVLDEIQDVIDRCALDRLDQVLSDLEEELESVLSGLDAVLMQVVASVRSIFAEIAESLRSVALTLGFYDADGVFHFHIAEDMTALLDSVKAALQDKVRQVLLDTKSTLGQALEQVAGLLEAVQSEIEGVRADLLAALEAVNGELENLHVGERLETVRVSLEKMLGRLGDIDFDPVVDPVINEIGAVRDQLKEIDLSSLNDTLKDMLKVGVEAIKAVNFEEDITDALLAEVDDILDIPKAGLKDIEEGIERALDKLTALDPDEMLGPLDDVFQPVTESLDAIRLERLLEPLESWHEQAVSRLDDISPAALLSPAVSLHERVEESFASISPDGLIDLLQNMIDGLRTELNELDISGMAEELSRELDNVRKTVRGLSPEKLLDPLVEAYDKIMVALDRFTPGEMLRPFGDIFSRLMAPLDNLTDDHVQQVATAFAGLGALPLLLDPAKNFGRASRISGDVVDLIRRINVGGVLSDLKPHYDALRAAFEAGGVTNESIGDILADLNPLKNEDISRSAARLQDFLARMEAAFRDGKPPDDLMRRYKELRPKLEMLVPIWARGDITARRIKEGLMRADPSSIENEVNQLYGAFKEQIRCLDPRMIQEDVRDAFAGLDRVFDELDPESVAKMVEDVMKRVNRRLEAVGLEVIREELADRVEGIESIIACLDPKQVIAQLEALTAEVRTLATDAIEPAEILNEIGEPFERAKEIVGAFDPAALKEPLREVFTETQQVISEIDIGVILEPLEKRLNEIRDELDESLKRTETAFREMIEAIPV
jgi:hypothetical protein